MGPADDLNDGNGLTYKTALKQARKIPAASPGSHTVGYVLDRYLAHIQSSNPKSTAEDYSARIEGILKPALGSIRLTKLRATDLTDWQREAAKTRQPATVNRLMKILRAALIRAWKVDQLIGDDSQWRQIPSLPGGTSRKVFLTGDQPSLLLKHCEPLAFQRLVQAGLLTGARLGELTGLRIQDFDAAQATLEIRGGKTGSRVVYLSGAAAAFFGSLAVGLPDALLLPCSDGTKWGKNQHRKLFILAVRAANLPNETVFYALRHTFISAALLAAVHIQVVAENCGTSVHMIEAHYGKFLRSDRRAMLDRMPTLLVEAP